MYLLYSGSSEQHYARQVVVHLEPDHGQNAAMESKFHCQLVHFDYRLQQLYGGIE